jgi:hypothetical protein
MTPSITCPQCHRTSYHPQDIQQGYCGACHGWTSPRPRWQPLGCVLAGDQGYGYKHVHDASCGASREQIQAQQEMLTPDRKHWRELWK